MKKHPEYQYLDLLRDLINYGDERRDRTQVGTKALFGREMRFDLRHSFPLLTTKRIAWKTAFKEMLWMLSGGHNIRELLQQNVHIWSEWPHAKYVEKTGDYIDLKTFEQRVLDDDAFAETWGDLGPVYGKQWRRWKTEDGQEIDQVQQVITALKQNPTSRRIIFDGWNVGELSQMALPPCHKHYQFFTSNDPDEPSGKLLHGACIQRSADTYLGLGFNIANLSMLTTILAQQTGYKPGEVVWYGLDVHLYLNHIPQALEQIERHPKPFPKLVLKNKPASLFDYTMDDFDMVGYEPHPHIKADVAI